MTVGDLGGMVAVAQPARRLWLPFTLPSFNELEAARGAQVQLGYGRRANGYDALKKHYQGRAVLFFRRSLPLPPGVRVVIACRWVEANRKRDPDGVAAGGQKIAIDALGPPRGGPRGWPGAAIIHCDGWHCVAGLVHAFAVDARAPGVELLLYEVGHGKNVGGD